MNSSAIAKPVEGTVSAYRELLDSGQDNIYAIHMGLPRGFKLEELLVEAPPYVVEPNWQEWGEPDNGSTIDHYIALVEAPGYEAATKQATIYLARLLAVLEPLETGPRIVVTDPHIWSEQFVELT